MRNFVWMTLAAGLIAAAAPAGAQTYNPRFPVCIQTYDSDGGIIECNFDTIAQCKASAAGRAAECMPNPFFSGSSRPPGAPARRY